MLTSKQRSHLRSVANTIQPTISIGKEGLTENVISQLGVELNGHELVKVSVLKTCQTDVKVLLEECCFKLNAEPVGSIGRRFILYRFSDKENFKHVSLQ